MLVYIVSLIKRTFMLTYYDIRRGLILLAIGYRINGPRNTPIKILKITNSI